MISKKQSLDKLYIANKNVTEAAPEAFASELSEFLDTIDPQTNNVIDAYATAEKQKDAAPLIKSEQELLHRLQLDNEAIEHYYAEHKMKPPIGYMGIEGTSEFCAYEKGIIISSQHILDSLIGAIGNSLSWLMNTNITNEEILALLQPHVTFHLNQKGQITSWQLTDSSDKGMQSAHVALNTYINNKKICNKQISKLLKEFAAHADKDVSDRSLFKRADLLSIIEILLNSNLKSTHHLAIVERFAFLNEDGLVSGLKSAHIIDHWRGELECLNRIKSARFWYAREQLNHFHRRWKKFNIDKAKAFYDGDFVDEFQKIEEIATGRQPQYAGELKRAQQKILSFIQNSPKKSLRETIVTVRLFII